MCLGFVVVVNKDGDVIDVVFRKLKNEEIDLIFDLFDILFNSGKDFNLRIDVILELGEDVMCLEIVRFSD